MENGFPLASAVQGSSSSSLTSRKPERGHGKVVMISSHPTWLRDHPLAEEDTAAADTVDLVHIFHEVLERTRSAPVLNMDDESVTVGQMIDQIWRRLEEDEPLRLSQILRTTRTERAVICLQLALLELLRLQAVLMRKDPHLPDILLKRNSALVGS
jgi:chromatin segregation and condensation protein Rec8/ScpA/Scc1 (kleisin family)